jgi:LemA protein
MEAYMSKSIWVILVLVGVAIFAIGGMNSIPVLEEKVNAKWAEVQNQYQRRTDLIPNLVETVKGYANFEQKTLTDVTEARASATKVTITPQNLSDPEAMKNFEAAQSHLSSALSRLMVASERYPDLKANQNFMALQSQLEGTENRISVARKDYIETVQDFNIRVRTFPGSLWASMKGAKPKQEFTAVEGAATPPAVKF